MDPKKPGNGPSPDQINRGPLAGLLASASEALGATICVLSASGQVLASSDETALPVGGLFSVREQDRAADIVSGGRLLGKLVALQAPSSLSQSGLEAFANAAAFLLLPSGDGSGTQAGPAPGLGSSGVLLQGQAQRALLDIFIENFPGVLAVMGPPPEFNIVLANTAFIRAVGGQEASTDSVIGKPVRAFSSRRGSSEQEFIELMTRVFKTGETQSFSQYSSPDPQLGTRYWDWTVVPVKQAGPIDDQGFIIMFAHEVTETVQSRQASQTAAALARSRADELEAVINQIAEGVVLVGATGNIIKLNPAAEALLGRGIDADRGAGLRSEAYGVMLSDGGNVSETELPSARALKGETVVGEQLIIRKPDEEEIFIRVSFAPLTDSEGHITGAVGVFHDITHETLIDKLKNEFVSIVSHELRTPLTAIMGYSDLMLRGVHGPLSDRQAKALNAVRANADRLLHLINDLLDISKLESGKVEIDAAPVDLAPIISRTIAQSRILAANAGVAIHNYVPQRSLPRVMGDETKLQQIVENLMTNAIKFTPPGGSVTFEASVSALLAGDPLLPENDGLDKLAQGEPAQSVIISVRDTGSGLDREQLERIWERFYQVDTTSRRRSGGAGLGLAIVRSLVELHGGLVWADSQGSDQGSIFRFSLPVASPRENSEAEAKPVPTPRVLRTPGKGERAGTVLVAEDDADQREIICEMLELEGYEVVLASDGERALELADEILPSAIILDVILPLADGWEVLHLLKQNPKTTNIPVLVISVVDQAGFGKRLGADEYLLKPLDPQKLRKSVNTLVGVTTAGSDGSS